MVLCPRCHRGNRPGRISCVYCSTVLPRAGSSKSLRPTAAAAPPPSAPPEPPPLRGVREAPRVVSAATPAPGPVPRTTTEAPDLDRLSAQLEARAPRPPAATPLPPQTVASAAPGEFVLPPPPSVPPRSPSRIPPSPPSPPTQFVSPRPPGGQPYVYSQGPSRRRRLALFAGIGAIVVVAIVLLAVLVGALRLSGQTPGSSVQEGVPLPYSEVAGPAAAEQATRPGAPWTPDDVLGFGLDSSYLGAAGLISGCSSVWENLSTLVVPATPSEATAGTVAFWAMASTNASGDLLLTFVTDVDGNLLASNSAVVTGSCTASFTALGAISTPVVDSTVVASAANTGGGSTFLATHPHSTELLGLLGPYWEVQYTTCSPFASGGTGTDYAALFWATNGTLFGTPGTGAEACSG